jgi:hypothetical protein
MAIKPIKLITPPGYPAVGQALGRARACLGSEDHCTVTRVGARNMLSFFIAVELV